jgi:hypothetical protein
MLDMKKAFCILFAVGLLFIETDVLAQSGKLFLGIKLRAEVQALADEVEGKTKRKISAHYTEFTGENEFMLGSSFIHTDGTPYLTVSINLKAQPKKVEAIVAHELLHLRLRANDYPVFLFDAKVKTRRGLAQDVEQSNVNDLTSLIEHRVFKSEMERFGLNEALNLAGDTARSAAARRNEADSQADAINFARAILEYQNPTDIEFLRRIYQQNKWQQSLKIGQEIAAIIRSARLDSPAATAATFKLCAAKLYPSPRPFRLRPDKTVTAYRQMLIGF